MREKRTSYCTTCDKIVQLKKYRGVIRCVNCGLEFVEFDVVSLLEEMEYFE